MLLASKASSPECRTVIEQTYVPSGMAGKTIGWSEKLTFLDEITVPLVLLTIVTARMRWPVSLQLKFSLTSTVRVIVSVNVRSALTSGSETSNSVRKEAQP